MSRADCPGSDDGSHGFWEEQTPAGTLILNPCLTCGMPAGEALKRADAELAHAAKHLVDMREALKESEDAHDSFCEWVNTIDTFINVHRSLMVQEAATKAIKALVRVRAALKGAGDGGA